MWFSKAIIHRAIHLMHATQFAISNHAPNIFPSALMFQAQQVSKNNNNNSSRSTSPRAMPPGHQALQSTRQYVTDKVVVEFPKLLWFFLT